MRTQTDIHSRPHSPYLLQLLTLSLLAIVTNSIDIPLQVVDRETEAFGQFSKPNIMISAHCRFGYEVGCSIPVSVTYGELSRLKSREELLLPPGRVIKRQPKVSYSPSRDSNSPSIHVSESRRIDPRMESSATVTPNFVNHRRNLMSESTSLSIASRIQISSLQRPPALRPGVEQSLPQSLLNCSDRYKNHFSSHHEKASDSSLPKDASGSTTKVNVSLKTASEKGFRRSVPTCQSMNKFHRLSDGKGNMRMHPTMRRQELKRGYPVHRLGRRLARLSPHGGDDLEMEKFSHVLLEDSASIAVDTTGPHVNISNHVEHWKAPPLESGSLTIIIVSQSGAADFSSIQEAVDSVPAKNTQRVIIRIHAGNYREKVTVPYNKPFISFHGDENGGTVISWNATASSSDNAREREVSATTFGRMDNTSASLFGTMHSASVTILSDGFVAQHMVFKNTAPPPEPGAVGAQAVAFLIGGDRAAFYYCSFFGAQDTLYDYTGRHYYLNCYIEGSIDFIFGNGRSLFEGCHLHSIAESFGAIAAHQRLSPEDDTGFSFDQCTVTGSGTLYLGRAWSPYARIVFARTYLENIISAAGWSDFGDPQRQSTTFFGQYQCTGPGADLSHRAPWAKLLTDNDVLPYLGVNFVNGRQWLGAWPMGPAHNGTGT